MNLSIKHNIMNRNTNYILIQKTPFKGKIITPEAFAAEPEIIRKIKTLPEKIFLESAEFLKFCKSINITPKISRAIKKRLAEVRQVNSKSYLA